MEMAERSVLFFIVCSSGWFFSGIFSAAFLCAAFELVDPYGEDQDSAHGNRLPKGWDAEDHEAKYSDLVDVLDGIPEAALKMEFLRDQTERERAADHDCHND